MDLHTQWVISSDVESLVAAIVDCRTKLVNLAKKSHVPMRVTAKTCDVYANQKVIELLRLSSAWKDLKSEDDPRCTYSSRPVASFPEFDLHTHDIMDEDVVRLVMDIAIKDEAILYSYFASLDLVKK
jgi:hypothetical protein